MTEKWKKSLSQPSGQQPKAQTPFISSELMSHYLVRLKSQLSNRKVEGRNCVGRIFPTTFSLDKSHQMALTLISDTKCFGGHLKRYSHKSSTLDCEMIFAIYLPPSAEQGKVPVHNLYRTLMNRCCGISQGSRALMRISLKKLELNELLLRKALLLLLLIRVPVI